MTVSSEDYIVDEKVKCLKRMGPALESCLEAQGLNLGTRKFIFSLLEGYREWLLQDDWHCIRIDQGDSNHQPVPKPEMRTMLRPIGDVLIWTDAKSEALLVVFIRDVLSGILAGCDVTLVHIGGNENSHIMLTSLEEMWRVMGWGENTFRVIKFDAVEAVSDEIIQTSCQAIAMDFLKPVTQNKLRSLLRKRDEVEPVFESKRAEHVSLYLPFEKKEESKKSLDQTLEYLRENQATLKSYGTFVLLPHKEVDAWMQEALDHLKNWTIAQGSTEQAKEFFLKKERGGEYSHGFLFFLSYKEPIDCLPFVKSLPSLHPIQVFGSKMDDPQIEPLIDEIEWKASLLSMNRFPHNENLWMASVLAVPSCGDLSRDEMPTEKLLVSRFMRPVCFQQVPDEYLPDALRRSKKNE
jgi:NADP-dependent aldehyde dehydrogenase